MVVFDNLDDAIALTPKVMNAGITPVCVEFMDNASIKQVEVFLDEKLPKSENGNYIIIQIAGDNEDVLMDQCEKIVELAEDNKAIDSLVADPAVIWKSRKAYLEADRARSLVFSMEDIVVPMTEIPGAGQQISRLGEKNTMLLCTALATAATRNVHIDILKDDRTQEEWEEMLPKIRAKSTLSSTNSAAISGEHGIGYKREALLLEKYTPTRLNSR